MKFNERYSRRQDLNLYSMFLKILWYRGNLSGFDISTTKVEKTLVKIYSENISSWKYTDGKKYCIILVLYILNYMTGYSYEENYLPKFYYKNIIKRIKNLDQINNINIPSKNCKIFITNYHSSYQCYIMHRSVVTMQFNLFFPGLLDQRIFLFAFFFFFLFLH